MKIVFDTNVVLDVLAKREPFVEASTAAFGLSMLSDVRAAITANTVTDIAYLLGKCLPAGENIRTILNRLMRLVDVLDVTKDTCLAAVHSPIEDYEDALLAVCAKRWGAEYIVTRDMKGFINSPVEAVTPIRVLEIRSSQTE